MRMPDTAVRSVSHGTVLSTCQAGAQVQACSGNPGSDCHWHRLQVIAGLVQRRREVKSCMKNERDQV